MAAGSQDRADVERAFSKYLQSLEAADVALAAEVWLQSPEIVVVTPIGRFQGWDGVKDIWARTQKEFRERKVRASDISIVVRGDVAWLVYDFVFSAKLADGKPLLLKGWESHGYQRTADGWRIAHLHYSFSPQASAGP